MTQPSTIISRRPGLTAVLVALLAGFTAITAAILARNNGLFLYSLDDPYIHLELAREIAGAHYGLNAGERVAPASSILWPLLLAPFALFGAELYAPLLINLAATVAIVVLIDDHLRLVVVPGTPRRELILALVTIAVVLCTNLVGLAFTGMEHSLQVLLTLLALRGLITLCAEDRLPWWLVPVLVLGPLVRYENLALSAPATLILLARGRFLAAFGVMTGIALGLGAFALFLIAQGLDPLPASVLAKSNSVTRIVIPGLPVGLTILGNLSMSGGVLLAAACILLIARAVRLPASSPERLLAMGLGLTALLHLIFGRFNWYGRYEIYAWTLALLGLCYLYREPIRRLLRPLPFGAAVALVVAALVGPALIYVYPTATTPAAAANLYRQQYQMRRLAVELYGKPVAVNDIGLVSYRNEAYVLDVYGLASAEALRLRIANPRDGRWMAPLAAEHAVGMAMVYDSWFGGRPPASWQRVGILRLVPFDAVAVAEGAVSIYATSPAARPAVESALARLETSLPPGAVLSRSVTERP